VVGSPLNEPGLSPRLKPTCCLAICQSAPSKEFATFTYKVPLPLRRLSNPLEKINPKIRCGWGAKRPTHSEFSAIPSFVGVSSEG
jgi:hypothetical protein